MPFVELTANVASAVLGRAGIEVAPTLLRLEARDERWLVRMPDDRIAWFAASERGTKLLATERRVLELVSARCSFAVPRITFADPSGDLQVRTMVPGSAEPFGVFEALRADGSLARRVGGAIGAMLAEQHTRIGADDVSGWLPERPAWPRPHSWIIERLPEVTSDGDLIASCEAMMRDYEAVTIDPADRALCHTDLGFHNLGIDSGSYEVHGAFDYEDAAFCDRHHDFRYLLLHAPGEPLLDAACSAYETRGGRPVDRVRVALYNAACAVTFLAFRAGTAPDDPSCGRKLSRDLAWTRAALRAVAGADSLTESTRAS